MALRSRNRKDDQQDNADQHGHDRQDQHPDGFILKRESEQSHDAPRSFTKVIIR